MRADVSVVIPAYNTAQYVATAIESALDQTAVPREVIVVDDGSSDETRAVVERFGGIVRYVFQQNQGVSAARNRGIDASSGRYVAFLDADDAWLPRKIEKQIAAIQRGNGRASYTAQWIVNDEMRPLFVNRNGGRGASVDALLTIGNVIGSPSSVLCERALFGEVGSFDGAFSTCADWEMWIRIATVTNFLFVDEPLLQYRVHGNNMSLEIALLERDSLRTLRKGFSSPVIGEELRELRRASLAHNYMVLAGAYLRTGRIPDALRCVVQSVARDPRQIRELLSYVARRASGKSGERSIAQHPETRSAR